jgi:hypothetical protein
VDDLDLDGHCETHRNREVRCVECAVVYVCTPRADLWHCPACFDGACNGRCSACHSRHRVEVHQDDSGGGVTARCWDVAYQTVPIRG